VGEGPESSRVDHAGDNNGPKSQIGSPRPKLGVAGDQTTPSRQACIIACFEDNRVAK